MKNDRRILIGLAVTIALLLLAQVAFDMQGLGTALFVFLLCMLVLVGLNKMASMVQDNRLKQAGVETEATLISAEAYRDEKHPDTQCFRGEYEFNDHLGERHVGSFSGHCHKEEDLLALGGLEFPLEEYYQAGKKGRLLYLRDNPEKHIFYGPKLTFKGKSRYQPDASII